MKWAPVTISLSSLLIHSTFSSFCIRSVSHWKKRCFLFHFALIWAFNSTLSAGFDRAALICNQAEAMTLFKCTQNMKDTGERRKREEGEREREKERLYVQSRCFWCDIQLRAQRNTEGPRERGLLGKTLLPAKKLFCYTSVCYQKKEVGRRKRWQGQPGNDRRATGDQGHGWGQRDYGEASDEAREGCETIMWGKEWKHRDKEKAREEKSKTSREWGREGVLTPCGTPVTSRQAGASGRRDSVPDRARVGPGATENEAATAQIHPLTCNLTGPKRK